VAIQPLTSPRFLFVSTYPPTRCGIATFTESLVGAMARIRGGTVDNGVIRMVTDWDDSISLEPEIVVDTDVTTPDWARPLGTWCTGYDLLWIQHEFGIFGPDDGGSVLDLCRRSPLPIATTLHTVMVSPSDRQRTIIESLGDASEVVVVMSKQAGRRLIERYDIDPEKVHVVPHGTQFSPRRRHGEHRRSRPTIVNWGLIGPGKGLETGIRAVALLRHIEPPPRLVIRGATHPNVKRREGEAYRDWLVELVGELGVQGSVEMSDEYMTPQELESLIHSADMALIPYDTTEQVTSGVLVDAIGAGLPVVATAFPHSLELLSSGAGRVVPHQDPKALATAIEALLTDSSALAAAGDEAMRVGRDFAWPRVALEYERLGRQVVTRDGKRASLAS
jgi:polysaccharide biosynthesis protein PslF